MDIVTLSALVPAAATAVVALPLGYALGMRRARRGRRESERALSAQSIDLLDARAECSRLRGRLERQPRRERLLRLLLTRLRDARAREAAAIEAAAAAERAAFLRESRLRLAAAEAEARAREAAATARHAATRPAREADEDAAASGTTRAGAARPEGGGEPVSVIDRERRDGCHDALAPLPPRERARVTRLAPSNGAQRPEDGDLGSIDGLGPDDEHRLNALGIHRVEQLARLTEAEERALVTTIEERPLEAWIGDARALLERRSAL